MKRLYPFPVAMLAFALAACENGQTISSDGFDPLVAPGGTRRGPDVVDSGYRPGQFVRTNMDNVAFFKQRPKGDADADKMLTGNTEMKVISNDGSYLKVELNSGEVGFVPSVLVTDQSSSLQHQAPSTLPPSGNEYQVYPLAPGLPPATDPTLPDIPPTIDPEAPITPPELPPSAPTPPVPDLPVPPVELEVPPAGQ